MDEADVELNPHIGPACMPRGVWIAIPTQAKKRTHYITGALNARTGQVFCTEYERKNSTLLLGLQHQLHRTCRSARRITFIAENYFFRKSAVLQRWPAQSRYFPFCSSPSPIRGSAISNDCGSSCTTLSRAITVARRWRS